MKLHLPLRDESDIAVARHKVRELGEAAAMAKVAIEEFATAVSEIARNAFEHGIDARMTLESRRDEVPAELIACVEDDGPGIRDVTEAMRDGYSTSNTLGLGLSSAQRLCDRFELQSGPGRGTRVVLAKRIAS